MKPIKNVVCPLFFSLLKDFGMKRGCFFTSYNMAWWGFLNPGLSHPLSRLLLDDIAKMLYILFMKKWEIEFLNETVEAEFECLPAEARAKTIHISNLIREFGLPNIGLPYTRHVQDKIWEIRALQGRSLYITAAGKKIIILRCFIKKSNKLPRKELKIAIKRAGEIKNG